MRSTQRRLALATGAIALLSIALAGGVAWAQPSERDTTPFRSQWSVIAGGGRSVGRGARAGREQAVSAIAWGRVISGEHGPGVLKGRLEMLVEITPLFMAFQSDRVEGAGVTPLMLRWNLRERGSIHPFLEIAGGVVATNEDVPEGTTQMNFVSHVGAGMRIAFTAHWGVLVGYRLHHLSNGSTAARNPGINSNVGYLGFAYRR